MTACHVIVSLENLSCNENKMEEKDRKCKRNICELDGQKSNLKIETKLSVERLVSEMARKGNRNGNEKRKRSKIKWNIKKWKTKDEEVEKNNIAVGTMHGYSLRPHTGNERCKQMNI